MKGDYIFFDGAEGDLDGVFDAVAETEMAGEVDVQGAEIEQGGGEVFFQLILLPAFVFNGSYEGAAIGDGNVELLHDRKGT